MSLEVELKFCDVDHEHLRDVLAEHGAQRLGRYFEENFVFDDEERSLRAQGILLRLRRRQGQAVLTVKHPVQRGGLSENAKVREELETTVGDFEVLRAGLEALGYRHCFAYHKVREKWAFAGCTVCLDLLPFGQFMEVEGGRADECAHKLGFDPADASTSSYHALNRAFRTANGLPEKEDFIFSDDERQCFEDRAD